MSKLPAWASALVLVGWVTPAAQDNEALRRQLKDTELVGRWIYDDVEAGPRSPCSEVKITTAGGNIQAPNAPCGADLETRGGNIVVDIFSFPGGRRFQFSDPHGNELAVWSDKE